MRLAEVQYSGQLGNCQFIQEPVRVRLERKQKLLIEQVKTVSAALKALDESPDFEKCHDAIIKAGF